MRIAKTIARQNLYALAACCDAFEDKTEEADQGGRVRDVLTWGGFGLGDRDERHG